MRTILWFCVSFLAMASTAWALEPATPVNRYIYRNYSRADGLPQNTAESLAQTTEGYLWFGTLEGLARFNGKQFKIFDRDNSALKTPVIGQLVAGPSGELFVGTELGLTVFRGEDSKTYTAGEGLPEDEIAALYMGHARILWVATVRGKLAKFHIDTEEITIVEFPSSYTVSSINGVFQSTDGVVWVGTEDGMVTIGEEQVRFYTTHNGLPSNVVISFAEDEAGHIWAGTAQGVVRIERRGDQVVVHRNGELEQLAQYRAKDLLFDKHGNLWLGTRANSLVVFKNGKVESALTSLRSSREIAALMEDREGNIWVGLRSYGAYQIRDSLISFLAPNAFSESNYTWSFLEDSSGVFWQGTDGHLFSHDQGETKRFDKKNSGLVQAVFAILELRSQDVIVGTNGQGLALMERGNLRFLHNEYPELVDKRIRVLYEDLRGDIWVGTRRNGLYRYAKGKLAAHFTPETGFVGARITGVAEKANGELIFGTNNGFVAWQGGRLVDLSEQMGLPRKRAYGIMYDREQLLWFGTPESGLFLYAQGKLHNFTKKHGLPANSAYAIVEDDSGHLWVSNNYGIFRVSRKEFLEVADGKKSKVRAVEFNRSSGFLNAECNGGGQLAGGKLRNGHLAFSCIDGVAIIDPLNLSQNDKACSTVFEQALADGELVPHNAQLPHTVERFEFRFAGLSYVVPEMVRYKYKLEPFDKEWVTSTMQSAFYTSLPAGEYTFRVVAANNDGVWDPTGTSLSFSIVEVFYKRWWFYVLCALAALLIVVAYVRYRGSIIQRRILETSELAWQRTRIVLEEQVDVVKQLVTDASTFSGDIYHLMGVLAASSSQVSAAVDRTVLTVREIEEMEKGAEEKTREIVLTATKTEAEAKNSRSNVEKSVISLVHVQELTSRISDDSTNLSRRIAEVDAITGLVGEISEQSAVLAINAAIEASKAGEYGLGFGVVAENMQELARRSKESTVQIVGILTAIHQAIEAMDKNSKEVSFIAKKSVEVMKNTNHVVGSLSLQMGKNSHVVEEISNSIHSQMAALRGIADAVGEFAATVDENTSISTEVSQNTERLNQSMADLLATMQNWQTPEFYKERDKKSNSEKP